MRIDWRLGLGGATCIALLAAASTAAPQTLPASGQKKCWTAAGAATPCADTGQDGELRAGAKLDLDDLGDGTLRDANTGLTWEKLARQGDAHDRDAVFTWEAAFAKLATLNAPPCFAGYCDWRMPNVKELQTIVDYQKKAPALAKAFSKQCKPDCAVAECSCTPKTVAGAATGFWSSTTDVSARSQAWQLAHATGATQSIAKSASGSMRAVRGGRPCSQAIATVITAFSSANPVSGLTVDLDYAQGKLTIPGTGSATSVQERIENISGTSGLFQVGDDDDQASVGLVSLAQAIPAGLFARVTLDCVAEQPPTTLADFGCSAVASDLNGLDVPASCTISLDLD